MTVKTNYMIQRLQSVYLSLTTLLSLLFLNGNILSLINKTGSVFGITFSGIIRNTQGAAPELIEKLLPLSIIILIVPIVALVAIFLFKNRILQMRIVMAQTCMVVLLILILGYYSYVIITKYDASVNIGFKMFLPIVLLILSALAYRGIKKDELLVKSYDRLR